MVDPYVNNLNGKPFEVPSPLNWMRKGQTSPYLRFNNPISYDLVKQSGGRGIYSSDGRHKR